MCLKPTGGELSEVVVEWRCGWVPASGGGSVGGEGGCQVANGVYFVWVEVDFLVVL